MRTRTRYALIAVGLLAAGCNRQPEPTGADFREVDADMVMTDFSSNVTAAGVRKARLHGDTARIFDDSTSLKVKKVNLVFFDELGAESGTLTSQTGDFNTATQAMIARGNVVLVTKVGNRRIETEELYYDPQQHRLWSNVKSVITEGASRVTTDSFTADDKFQNFTMKNTHGPVQNKIKF